jgi:hypothetical protein
MPNYVEGVASRFGSPVKQVAFPFDANQPAKMTMGTPNNVIEQNIVELSCSPLVLIVVRDQQFFFHHHCSIPSASHFSHIQQMKELEQSLTK